MWTYRHEGYYGFQCGDVKKGENIIKWGKYMSMIFLIKWDKCMSSTTDANWLSMSTRWKIKNHDGKLVAQYIPTRYAHWDKMFF